MQPKFIEIPGPGYHCPEHKTEPKTFYVDLPRDGARVRIFSDEHGKVLDSYGRADTIIEHLNYETAS